jgi:beta-lactamase regulating signal transducer with metallopeptidase domain
MFVLRGIAISFSVFVLVYIGLSMAVALAWRAVSSRLRARSERRHADLFFAMRISPIALASLVTAALTIPSFLIFEPRATDEPVGGILLSLSLFGVSLGIFGVLNAILALRQVSRAVAQWKYDAQTIHSLGNIPVFRMSRPVPAMVAAGIARPQVLISSSAESVLTAGELHSALNHELVHLRHRDNLKKLLLRFVPFPGMAGLEAAWREAAEMAADDAAVSSCAEALDLAAALIKLSRLGPVEPPLDLTAALVYGPAALMNARVERLISWSEDRRAASLGRSWFYPFAAVAGTLAILAVTYSQLLLRVHEATEWLVR